MYIRFEDEHGMGVYQGETEFRDPKFMGIFELAGLLTRAPHQHTGAVEGHSCLGVDEEIGDLISMDSDLKFAWRYEFFLRIINGQLTDEEQALFTKDSIPNLKYLTTRQLREEFISVCAENGITVMLINGSPAMETEQQAVLNMNSMDMIDVLSKRDHFLLSIDAEVF